MKKRVSLIVAIFFVILILAAVVFLMIPETVLKFKSEDGSDLDIESVYDWGRLCDICSGQAFLSLNENEQKELLDKAIAKIQVTYQFESYEYNIKQKPIVVSLHYPDGRTEAVQLQPSNPLEN